MIEDPEIARLRQEIDEIDQELLTLVRRRAEVVLRVGDRKRERGLPVYDAEREEWLLQRLARGAERPLDRAAAERVFRQVVRECRRLEDEHMRGGQVR